MKSDSNKKPDSLKNRIIYGFLGFVLVLGGILGNAWTYFFVFFVICLFCMHEYYGLLIRSGKQPSRSYGIVVGISIYCLSFLVSNHMISSTYYLWIYPVFSALFVLKLYDKHEKQPFENMGLTLLGIIYIAVPFSTLNMAVFIQGVYSYQVILGTFFLIWIHDIGAYFVGIRYGKRRLFERISPNKTWEGSFGGAFLTAVMVGLVAYYFRDLALWQWAVIGGIVVVVGTYGDLIESMLKRSIQVKDSSGAIPGHGGFLDRFDNLLLSAPFIAAFLKIF
ncbi:MAG: phosphatidate cytidylyltransferase [Bacteroidia bacterium]|nr:phosphatidate cytidylyltransferase [Bacteroidia bacterium]